MYFCENHTYSMKRTLLFLFCFLPCLIACEKKQEEIAVSSVSLNQPTADMIIGETIQLQVSITPSNATEKNVIWGSSKQSVATVSNGGLVSAISEGSSTITATVGGKSASCQVIVSKGTVEVSSVTFDVTGLELLVGENVSLVATVKPDDATDKTIMWSSSAPDIASVDGGVIKAVKSGESIVTAMAGSKKAECKVVVKEQECPEGAVDMNVIVTREDGSMYKLFIAKCNLGANSPEEIGDYYAWGEVETKDSYIWETYKWRKEGTSMDVNKYGYNPDLDIYSVVLEPEDDVAHVKLGGRWRMPTFEELDALIRTIGNTSYNENYTAEWKTINGSLGVEIIYTPNSNSVFFPVTGRMVGSKITEISKDQVFFWSSSAANYENDSSQAWYMSMEQKKDYKGDYFTSVGYYTWGKNGGIPIRPVSD